MTIPTTARAPTAWKRPAALLLLASLFAGVPLDPLAEFRVTLAGNTLPGAVGCVPKTPFPTMTIVPLLGTPFTTTNSSAGPGCNRFGFGGACATCSVIEPSLFTVYV